MPTKLILAAKPYKSSHLAIPPSPFSPKFPIAKPGSPPPRQQTKGRPRIDLPSHPAEPLNWLWQCHLCNRVYQLGVTRRCLDDGHFFCAGTTTVKRSRRSGNKKSIRHKACASEFDYQGWKAWSTWRRDVAEQIAAAEALEEFLNDQPMSISIPTKPEDGRWLSGGLTRKPSAGIKANRDFWAKDCWNKCDYPSECRWGKQYGVPTPVVSVSPATFTVPSSSSASQSSTESTDWDKRASTSFDDLLLDITPSINDPMPEPETGTSSQTTLTSPEEATKKVSMDDLLESAKRRKRRSAGQLPSPLASNPPSPVESESPEPVALTLQKAIDDFDIDVRRTFERAGVAVSNFVSGRRNSAALEDEKAEAFVSGLKVNKKKSFGIW